LAPGCSSGTSPRQRPRTCSLEVVIWYNGLLEISVLHTGLEPNKPNAHDGRTKKMQPSVRSSVLICFELPTRTG
jgi:hypothetical protein